MKTLVAFILMITTVSLNSWAQEKKVNKLLEEKQARTEIFKAIQNNHEYMMEFMQISKDNQHASAMLSSMNMNGKMHQGTEAENKAENCKMMTQNTEMSCCIKEEKTKQPARPKYRHK